MRKNIRPRTMDFDDDLNIMNQDTCRIADAMFKNFKADNKESLG